jgi:hypothetical protein
MEHAYEGFVNNISCRRGPRQYRHEIGWKITFIQHLGPFSIIQIPIFGATIVSRLISDNWEQAQMFNGAEYKTSVVVTKLSPFAFQTIV